MTYFFSQHKRGFSLIELIIYIAILSVLSLGVSSAFLSFNRGKGQVAVRSEVNTNLRFAIEKITQDLNGASAVAVPGTTALATSTLSATVSGTNVTYCVIGGQLRRQAGSACTVSSEVITSPAVSVSTTTFRRIENTNTVLNKTTVGIIVDLTMRSSGTNPDQQYSASERVTVNLK
jgi:prepilin-type N-terminal cleavage/methylation domain-containing protein